MNPVCPANAPTYHPLRGQRIYLASRFARRDELRAVAAELVGLGAEVVSRWLLDAAPLTCVDLRPGGRGEAVAAQDIADLRRATILVAFTEPALAPQGRGGRHVELGIAIGRGIRVIGVGPREHVFHCTKNVEWFDSWSAARYTLATQLSVLRMPA
jgi:nucleoside 2-deoxyribosyltransferase